MFKGYKDTEFVELACDICGRILGIATVVKEVRALKANKPVLCCDCSPLYYTPGHLEESSEFVEVACDGCDRILGSATVEEARAVKAQELVLCRDCLPCFCDTDRLEEVGMHVLAAQMRRQWSISYAPEYGEVVDRSAPDYEDSIPF